MWSSTLKKEKWSTQGKQYFSSQWWFPFCHIFKKTIKEDRQNWESNRRLIGGRKMSANFTDHPQGMCSPWWKKDARISAQSISSSFCNGLLKREMMTSFLYCVASPQSIYVCTKDKVRKSVCLCVLEYAYMHVLYALCQSLYCYCRCSLPWSRQVLAPNLSHLCSHDRSIPSS